METQITDATAVLAILGFAGGILTTVFIAGRQFGRKIDALNSVIDSSERLEAKVDAVESAVAVIGSKVDDLSARVSAIEEWGRERHVAR